MCRVTMGHLRVTIGNPRVTVGNPRVTIGHLRVTMGHLRQLSIVKGKTFPVSTPCPNSMFVIYLKKLSGISIKKYNL